MIAGAGVLGLCAAFELHRRGHAVKVVDPGRPNASSVAAGMIAPAMESAIDDVSAETAQLFRAGRDLWPDFAEASGVILARRSAQWRGGDVDAIEARLRKLGFAMHRNGDCVATNEDYQVDPAQALPRLQAALGDVFNSGEVEAVEAEGPGWRITAGGATLHAGCLILATGAAGAIAGLPDAVAAQINAIQPIRGQIGRTPQRLVDAVVRGPGAYVAPMQDGAVMGATMEPGRRDTDPDADAAARLTAAAWRNLDCAPQTLDIDWRVGVRGASADGLPLAGRATAGQGLFMALAPRRNGWLLGPLAARLVADAIEGRAASPQARALDPARFSPPSRTEP